MDASVEALYGEILLKFKKFVLEEGGNEISVSQNFIHAFSDTVGELHGSNRCNTVIGLSTVEVPAPPATDNDILLDSDIPLDSDQKTQIQHVVYDTDPDFGDSTLETMGDTLNGSDKGGGVYLGFPGESGCVVGSQAVVGIHQ